MAEIYSNLNPMHTNVFKSVTPSLSSSSPDMAGEKSSNPQFFRVMLPGFFSELPLPVAFVKKHINHNEVEEKLRKATILSPTGKPWQVTLRRSEDESTYSFQEGWLDCTQAHLLKEGYFLLFVYKGDLVFDFTVFDRTTCMKPYPLLPSHHTTPLANGICRPITRSQNKNVHDEESSSSRSRRSELLPSFEATINTTSLRYLFLPKRFVSSAGFSTESGESYLTLRDQKNRSWTNPVVHIRREKKPTEYYSYVRGSWRSFVSANKLKLGDRCLFEMADGEKDVLNVRILTFGT